MKNENAVELMKLDDPRVEDIDARLDRLVGDVSAEHNLDPFSVTLCLLTQVVRQMAYVDIADTASYLSAMTCEVASNYSDDEAQQRRIEVGARMSMKARALAQQMFGELEEARANGRVS